MNEKQYLSDPSADEMDYSARPFDYRDRDSVTSMVCEHDAAVKQKVCEAMRLLNFNVVEPTTVKEALKYTTFHTFNLIVVNENFDVRKDGINYVLQYVESLPMVVRRKIFVVLISQTFATMDYMNSLNKSVNLIINAAEISELGMILKREMEENEYFYHVFNEMQRKMGKI
jgi:hypothetical protein